MATATAEPAAAATAEVEGTDTGPDADRGKLFDVPRVTVLVDDADPTVLKLAFSGGVDIERADKQWVDFYNQLRHGKPAELKVTIHVAGTKKIHRRDNEGAVDAIVETKSLIITDVHEA